MRRILAVYRKGGAAALAHGNRGRRPANTTTETKMTYVVQMARTRYAGTNHTHLTELLIEREWIDLSHSTVRRILVSAGMDQIPITDRTRLLSDNGPGYVSRAFRDYLGMVGIKHILATPFHPQTNGKLERYHQTLKRDVNQLPCEMPSDLEAAFVSYYNYRRGTTRPGKRHTIRRPQGKAAGDPTKKKATVLNVKRRGQRHEE